MQSVSPPGSAPEDEASRGASSVSLGAWDTDAEDEAARTDDTGAWLSSLYLCFGFLSVLLDSLNHPSSFTPPLAVFMSLVLSDLLVERGVLTRQLSARPSRSMPVAVADYERPGHTWTVADRCVLTQPTHLCTKTIILVDFFSPQGAICEAHVSGPHHV